MAWVTTNMIVLFWYVVYKGGAVSGGAGPNMYIYYIYIYIDHMGVSENSVPLNPMVNDHYPY